MDDVETHVAEAGAAEQGNVPTRLPADLPWLKGGDDRYNEPTVEKTIEAVTRAAARLEPVTAHAGRGMDGRFAFNRRFVMRDGTTIRHPRTCDPNILHCEGPTDPEVGVLALRNASDEIVAMLIPNIQRQKKWSK